MAGVEKSVVAMSLKCGRLVFDDASLALIAALMLKSQEYAHVATYPKKEKKFLFLSVKICNFIEYLLLKVFSLREHSLKWLGIHPTHTTAQCCALS